MCSIEVISVDIGRTFQLDPQSVLIRAVLLDGIDERPTNPLSLLVLLHSQLVDGYHPIPSTVPMTERNHDPIGLSNK